MADCLVVGGNGFLGSHVVDALVTGGHRVTVFDRFGFAPESYTARDVHAVSGDFLNRADLKAVIEGHEVVFHFVSLTDPASAEKDPMLDVRTNVMSSVELLQVCAEAGVARVVYASSGGAIYGDQDRMIFDEESPTVPVSPYAIGKLAVEGYLRYFKRTTGLDYTVLRISNPYGPRQNPRKRQGVIPIFLRQIAQGRPVTILGDGSMVRDYVYVADVASMVSATATRTPRHHLYNLGSGRGVTITALLGVITEVTGVQPQIEHVPRPPTYVDHVVLDTQRFRNEYGEMVMTSLEEGVSRTWQSVKEEM